MVYKQRELLDLASVKVFGSLDSRIRLALTHLLRERNRIVGGAGHSQSWGSAEYGRWIYAVTNAASYTKEHIPALKETVQELLSIQSPNGSFCEAVTPGTWHGSANALLGLMEYWEKTHDGKALEAAVNLGNFYISHFPLTKQEKRNPNVAHLEGLIALWKGTKDDRYLHLAEKIAETITGVYQLSGG